MRKAVLTILVVAAMMLGYVPQASAIVAGAGYTTFDAAKPDSCLNSKNGINCNLYEKKQDVYMSGGPTAGGLSDGWYYFAVLVPGAQNGGFVDGAEGNLSDTTKHMGKGSKDKGSGDDVSNRTFRVENKLIVEYHGTHKWGVTPNGKDILQLAPYDDTSNNGGVYILAICQVGATSPSQCKYDAFKVKKKGGKPGGPPGGEEDPFPTIAGKKYYDANVSGEWEAGEVGIEGWAIELTDVALGITNIILTDVNGDFSVEVLPGTYVVSEMLPLSTAWMQTGNILDQSLATGAALVDLRNDKTYEVIVDFGDTVMGLYFGNVCLGFGGGHTPGFWHNINGQEVFESDLAGSLSLVVGLNLRNADGSHFDPVNHAELSAWLVSTNAVNMAHKLSSHLAAMELNVYHDFVADDAVIYAPGVSGASVTGFIALSTVLDLADASLGLYGYTPEGHSERETQTVLKNAIDDANNDKNFLQAGPASCPLPVFTLPTL